MARFICKMMSVYRLVFLFLRINLNAFNLENTADKNRLPDPAAGSGGLRIAQKEAARQIKTW
jgi:hypothetical protein